VGLRAGLDTEARRKILFASSGDRTSIALSSSPYSDTILSEPFRLHKVKIDYVKYATYFVQHYQADHRCVDDRPDSRGDGL
jgi:hypothetical protein